MTTEEKAKAYDEAIMVAKSCLEKGTNPANNPLDYFIDCVCKMFPDSFPELRESEDERIRKEIISIVKEYGRICEKEGDPCSTINDCLAYLEKQKEPHYTKRNALFDKCVENCDPKVIKGVSDNVDEMLQKVKKPVYEDEFQKMLADSYKSGKNEVIDNPEKYGLQKPAEWSEEDERMLKEIVSFFKDGTVKLQHDLDLYAGFLQNKFKSIRPSWKSSEEQKYDGNMNKEE